MAGEPGQIARVETLLASVRDIMSSLHLMSVQLEREVSHVLHHLRHGRGSSASEPAEALQAENAQLKQALEGRAAIEQAKGMLMAQYRCSPDRAFEMLVALSRSEQRKVREIAAEIVEGGERAHPLQIDLATTGEKAASGRRRGG